jgi:phosphoenolpyruvate-protein kinase (PTS system EI component)
VSVDERPAEGARALAALEAAAADIEALAARVRATSPDDAEIIETGALMARDPALAAAVGAAAERGRSAPAAILEAAGEHAEAIAALADATLAARADDVRSIGRRAARLAAASPSANGMGEGEVGLAAAAPPGAGASPDRATSLDGAVLVARDLGPADVAEHAGSVAAIALAAGGVAAHAAIVARSLGIPMVVGLGDAVLAACDGAVVAVDGTEGVAILDPSPALVDEFAAEAAGRLQARAEARAARDLPAVTRDGRAVRVLVNVSGAAEAEAGLEAGAEGVGLLRTELAFLDARAWPGEEEHLRALAPVLARLYGRTATVRVLDFGGDKTPPFLAGTRARALRLLLDAPDALDAQLRAILRAGRHTELRILLPMVRGPVDLLAGRDAVLRATDAVAGAEPPPVGAMVETPRAAGVAHQLAVRADFLSVGTNDLTAATLGEDRFAEGRAPAHHPRVLGHIARVVAAARAAGIPVEVCGEAASDPRCAPLLVGLGVDELSVGAARVGAVRGWVRSLDASECAALAAAAVAADGPEDVEALVAPVAARLERLERGAVAVAHS